MLGLAKYPGGKQRLAQTILRHLPSSFTWYVEPFCGNSPFLQPKFHNFINPYRHKIWVNDLDADVINVVRTLKDNPSRFIDKLLARKVKTKTIAEVVEEFEKAKVDWIEKNDASAYVYLRRLSHKQIVSRKRSNLCSISPIYSAPAADGVTRNGMLSVTRKRLVEAAVVADRIDKVTNLDYREVLADLPDDCVLYLDPPYWTSRVTDWYTHYFTEQQHVELAEILHSLDPANHKFLLSLEISELSGRNYVLPQKLKWKTVDVIYSCGKGAQRVKELLISNYPL